MADMVYDTKLKEEKQKTAVSSGIRFLQGTLIGLGAVLPGISGGVLCVVFGVYQTIMEILSHPLRSIKKHFHTLLPLILGGGFGFVIVAKLLGFLLDKYPAHSVCFFVGLIIGMIPSLFREAGAAGRSQRFLNLSRNLFHSRTGTASEFKFYTGGNYAEFWMVFVLRFLYCFECYCAGTELFDTADADRALHTFGNGNRKLQFQCSDPSRRRCPDDCSFAGKGCRSTGEKTLQYCISRNYRCCYRRDYCDYSVPELCRKYCFLLCQSDLYYTWKHYRSGD